MRVLLWNTHKNKSINPILCDLILENDISLVVLLEYRADEADLLKRLAEKNCEMQQYITTGCERIRIFGKAHGVKPAGQSPYASFQLLNQKDILCCVHLTSKLYGDSEGIRDLEIRQIVSDIRSLEMERQTENTILVGDFNIDPYDMGCTDARWFHGLPVYEDAQKKTRTIAGHNLHMFYNPMWNFLGDFTKPYGTYYYGGSGTNQTFWHIYDQVLIRPAMRSRFVDQSLKILTETSSACLLNRSGKPDQKISDHLPVVFEILEG